MQIFKEMHRLITILLIGVSLAMPVKAQTVPAGLIDALKNGDYSPIAFRKDK